MQALIVADSNEINALENYGWSLCERQQLSKRDFYFYQKKDKKVIVVHSGIGLVNAAATTQILITKFAVKQIYNYGAVGGSHEMAIYDLVVPKNIYFYDVETPWYAFGQTPQEAPFFFNDLEVEGLKTNSLASGNSFLDNNIKVDYIKKNIPVDIFDMEAAAIAQICFQNQVRLYIIKAVSDIIGLDGTSLENINLRIAKAGKKALDELMKFI